MSINKSVARAASLISFATLCSRLLGFLRDIIIARLFGIYAYAQAFVVAFKIPNLFRDFLGEGAANAAFVPVFSEYTARHSKEEFWELANVVLNLLLAGLAAVTILGIIFSPLIVRLIAPGFIADPQKLEITVRLNRAVFPYLLLIGLVAYAAAILNSLKHFAVPAFAPCLLNISIIVFALIFGESIKGLALGVLAGGALQLAVQIPVLYKKGFHLELFRKFKHPEARVIAKLMLPRILSSGIYQLNNFVDSIFGSLAWIVGEGGVAVLYFSYRLVLFPQGIFTNALAQAILPVLSIHALEPDHKQLKETLAFGLRAAFFVMLPAGIALMALASPIISLIFCGGKFDSRSAQLTAGALFFYSIGLFAYGAVKILQSCFFALKDTLTPTKVVSLALAANIVLNFFLMSPLKIRGLALATSLSGIISFLSLFASLKRKIGDFGSRKIIISFLRILAASICMGVVCYFVYNAGSALAHSRTEGLFNLGLTIICGLASYIAFCFIFRVSEIRELWNWTVNRKEIL